MLHELLASYLDKVERAVRQCGQAYVEHYVEEVLTPKRVNLRIRIRFASALLLEISEAIIIKDGRRVPLDYWYHCQDGSNRLVFRYDCTPHHPGLASFPHHKHVPAAVLPSTKPDIEHVVAEASAAAETAAEAGR